MNWNRAFMAGFLGGAVMTVMAAFARSSGLTDLNLEMVLGAFATADVGPGPWLVGLSVHLMISGAIAWAYGAAMEAIRRRGTFVGLAFAVVHATISGRSD